MSNRQNDFIFEYFIKGLGQTAQATLRQMYMESQRLEAMNRRREYEQLKQDVLDYVISHLSATVDISEVLMQIDELKRAIESLGK